MDLVLLIVGIFVIIVSIITGYSLGEFHLFLYRVSSGTIVAMIFFALSKIISNQEEIKYYLRIENNSNTKVIPTEMKKCSKCNKEYDKYQTSCPYCGNRE
ncbi:MAG: hypothetical protein N4A63_05605 [Vallitalea sp.]|jgi:reverse gyrase|nr:hypothetical protein [Vallitalea sp.]